MHSKITYALKSQLLKPLKNPTNINKTLTQIIIQNKHFTHITLIQLLDTYISSYGFTFASLIFTNFSHLINSHICNSVIKTYTHLKKHWHSIFIHVQMHRHGISTDLLTFPALIKSISHLRCRKVGKLIHCCVVKMGFDSDLYCRTSLVHMYSLCGSVDDAHQVFDEMSERNSVSWNALITGYVCNRRFVEGIGLFKDMLNDGVSPWEVTMVEVLSACSNLGDLEQGKWVHDYVKRNGLVLNVYVGTALIDMYAKCGFLEAGIEVFEAMIVKNVCTWNVLISGYVMNGREEDALLAFCRMIFSDYQPDEVTYLAVLSACYHRDRVCEGQSHFKHMKDEFGLEPKMEHYSCMVDLQGRAGFLDEVIELIRSMPFEPDPSIWRALLRVSQIHGNTHLSELVILRLIELEPSNGDNYLLLSNMYVQQQRWTEVGITRGIMKDRCIQKIPGSSSAKINDVMYEFVASCNVEFEHEELYKLLDNISMDVMQQSCVVHSEML